MIEALILILSVAAISVAAMRIQVHKWRQWEREHARRAGYQAWRLVKLARKDPGKAPRVPRGWEHV